MFRRDTLLIASAISAGDLLSVGLSAAFNRGREYEKEFSVISFINKDA